MISSDIRGTYLIIKKIWSKIFFNIAKSKISKIENFDFLKFWKFWNFHFFENCFLQCWKNIFWSDFFYDQVCTSNIPRNHLEHSECHQNDSEPRNMNLKIAFFFLPYMLFSPLITICHIAPSWSQRAFEIQNLKISRKIGIWKEENLPSIGSR